jgi:hypothetical protein
MPLALSLDFLGFAVRHALKSGRKTPRTGLCQLAAPQVKQFPVTNLKDSIG